MLSDTGNINCLPYPQLSVVLKEIQLFCYKCYFRTMAISVITLHSLYIHSHRTSDFKYLEFEIGQFFCPIFWVTGTPVYSRENMFVILGNPTKIFLKVMGTQWKLDRNFGSRNYLSLISSARGSYWAIIIPHFQPNDVSFRRCIVFFLSCVIFCKKERKKDTRLIIEPFASAERTLLSIMYQHSMYVHILMSDGT